MNYFSRAEQSRTIYSNYLGSAAKVVPENCFRCQKFQDLLKKGLLKSDFCTFLHFSKKKSEHVCKILTLSKMVRFARSWTVFLGFRDQGIHSRGLYGNSFSIWFG